MRNISRELTGKEWDSQNKALPKMIPLYLHDLLLYKKGCMLT